VTDGGKAFSIRWNGKEITDPAELPPDVRKLIAYDANGVPYVTHAEKISTLGTLEIESTTESETIESDEESGDEQSDDEQSDDADLADAAPEDGGDDLPVLPSEPRPVDAGLSIVWNGKKIGDLAALPPTVREMIEKQVIPRVAGRAAVVTCVGTASNLRVKVDIALAESAGGGADLPRAAPARPPREPVRAPAAQSFDEPARPRPVGPSWGIIVVFAGLGAALLLYLLLRPGR
jgi:hypothetical protein